MGTFYLPPFTSRPMAIRAMAAKPDWWFTSRGLTPDVLDGRSWNCPITIGILGTGLDPTWARLDKRITHWDRDSGNGHETLVTSIVAAGVPKTFSIRVYCCLGPDGGGTMEACRRSYVQAVNDGCQVINGSFGGMEEDKAFLDELKRGDGLGVLNVFAAGNEGPDAFSFPAAGKYTLSIGAHDERIKRAPFSGRQPDFMAGGVGIRGWWLNGRTMVADGTSFATPCATVAVALWLSAMREINAPDTSGSVLVEDLKAACEDMETPGTDRTTGFGAIRFDKLLQRVLDRVTVPVPPKPPIDAPIYIPAPPAGKRWRLVAEDVGVSST